MVLLRHLSILSNFTIATYIWEYEHMGDYRSDINFNPADNGFILIEDLDTIQKYETEFQTMCNEKVNKQIFSINKKVGKI